MQWSVWFIPVSGQYSYVICVHTPNEYKITTKLTSVLLCLFIKTKETFRPLDVCPTNGTALLLYRSCTLALRNCLFICGCVI